MALSRSIVALQPSTCSTLFEAAIGIQEEIVFNWHSRPRSVPGKEYMMFALCCRDLAMSPNHPDDRPIDR